MQVAYSWIIYSFVIFGPSVLCDRKLERRQTESSCSGNTDDSYHCSKNVCIDWMSVCDGYVDCSDGSDEDNDMCGRYDYETNMAMDCGKVRTNNQVISKKGSMEALVSTAPWYVRIFRFSSRMNGGIIIAPNVVISVASDIYYHEIIHKSKKSTKISVTNISEYSVNVGRDGIEFMTGDKIKNIEFHQKINVETIYLREGYKEYGSEDIAILVLVDKIPFRDGLAAPVCIDWRNKYGVFNGDQGKVVVYNQTSSKDNDGEYTYFEKNTSYLNSITCAKHYPDMCGPVTSYEQFCALRKMERLYNFYGLGITFLHSNSYFLTGVNTLCDGGIIIMVEQYLDLKFYVHWIRGIINKHVTVHTCVLPTVEGVVYSYENSEEILPHGTVIDQNLKVIENCNAEYHKAYPSRFRFCQGKGKWVTNSEKLCFKMCSPLNSDSLDIKCSYNGKYANCSNLSIPNTIANLSCKSTHSASNKQNESPKESICQSNGLWNEPLYKCNPNCGKIYTKIKLLINNGTKALVGTAPWNVGIYRFDKTNSNHNFICGGSIISPYLVVSAAHCFWNQGMLSNTISISDGLYKIAVGKYDRNFTTIDNEFTKIINVKIVYLREDYNGHTGSYFEDIAIIVLENKVSFSEGVAPVCIDWNGNYKLFNGDQGKIVGWGKTENGSFSSSLLKHLYRTSTVVLVGKFIKTILNGQGVGQGDSGAGLCFLHSGSYYLTGVVSSKDPNKKYSIATFTEIKYHIEWIRGWFDIYNRL